MTDLPHDLTRSLVIRAPRELVFRYFVDAERFARWWGAGSSIEGRVGGEMCIRYPNDVIARGEVTEFEPDRRVAFTYGYENAHPELPPGSSLVTIELHDHADGTRLEFRHQLPDAKLRDQHVPGWRYHLAVFANVTSDEHHGDAAATIDRWFEAWAEHDDVRRGELLTACASDDVTLRDAHACLTGRDELHGHIANTHRHVPGLQMRRDGEPRHCQGTVLVQWRTDATANMPELRGTNVVHFAPDGRIRSVTGVS